MKNLPKNEVVCVHYHNRGPAPLFVMTRNTATGGFFLYRCKDGEYERLGKSDSPQKLETKFKIFQEMGYD